MKSAPCLGENHKAYLIFLRDIVILCNNLGIKIKGLFFVSLNRSSFFLIFSLGMSLKNNVKKHTVRIPFGKGKEGTPTLLGVPSLP